MKNKIKTIFYVFGAIAFICAYVYFMLIEPIIQLNNKKDLHTVKLGSAYDILVLEHSINGLIPIGKDYYYVGIEKDTQNAYIIRASKKWLTDNFNSDYSSKEAAGFEITALSLKIGEYEVRDELIKRMSQAEGITCPLGLDYCLEYSYRSIYIKRLVLFGISILLIIAGILIHKNKETIDNKISIVYFVFILAFIAYMITVL